MPRPNHDIPGVLLGGINDYADREEIKREEAHSRLLRIGLMQVGILPIGEHCETEE